MYVCVCVYVCMYLCMYVCNRCVLYKNISILSFADAIDNVSDYVCMPLCMSVCMSVCDVQFYPEAVS